MSLAFQRFVASRYIRGAEGREEGRRFLRFVIYVAIGGVAVGVAALLLALSIVRGFSREIEAKIIGFGAHVQVESVYEAPLRDANRMAARLESLSAVSAVSPVVTEFALLRRSATEIDGVALWGTEHIPPYLASAFEQGTTSFAPDTSGLPGLVLGKGLARVLGVTLGDRLTAFSMRRSEGGAGPSPFSTISRPRVRQFHVAGIYETSLSNFDDLFVFVDIAEARRLLDYAPDQVTRFDLTLHDVEEAGAVALAIEEDIGFPVMAKTIYQVYRGLFAWVDLQESIIPLVIGIIIIVAAFNIVGTLLMIILEKSREIGVLASMGATRKAIRRLYLWVGGLIGGIGTSIGLSLAFVLGLLQKKFALIPLPAEAYYMSTAPIELNPLDFVIVGAIALLLCALSAYLPARFAARIEPLRVIRFS